jgi:hypothetical protein
VYGLRSTDPKGLWKVADPVGHGDDAAIAEVVGRAGWIVCGWGKNARADRIWRIAEVLAPAAGKVFALSVNGDGSPSHPLYLPAASLPQPYSPLRGRVGGFAQVQP